MKTYTHYSRKYGMEPVEIRPFFNTQVYGTDAPYEEIAVPEDRAKQLISQWNACEASQHCRERLIYVLVEPKAEPKAPLITRFHNAEDELKAWRAQFPQYEYRPQDECIALKWVNPHL